MTYYLSIYPGERVRLKKHLAIDFMFQNMFSFYKEKGFPEDKQMWCFCNKFYILYPERIQSLAELVIGQQWLLMDKSEIICILGGGLPLPSIYLFASLENNIFLFQKITFFFLGFYKCSSKHWMTTSSCLPRIAKWLA